LGDGGAQRAQAHHANLELCRRVLRVTLPEPFGLLPQYTVKPTVKVQHGPAHVLSHALAVGRIDYTTDR